MVLRSNPISPQVLHCMHIQILDSGSKANWTKRYLSASQLCLPQVVDLGSFKSYQANDLDYSRISVVAMIRGECGERTGTTGGLSEMRPMMESSIMKALQREVKDLWRYMYPPLSCQRKTDGQKRIISPFEYFSLLITFHFNLQLLSGHFDNGREDIAICRPARD